MIGIIESFACLALFTLSTTTLALTGQGGDSNRLIGPPHPPPMYRCDDDGRGEPMCVEHSTRFGPPGRPGWRGKEIIVSIPNHGEVYYSWSECKRQCRKEITVIDVQPRHPYYYCDRGACLGCDYIVCPEGEYCGNKVKCDALGRSLYTSQSQCNGCHWSSFCNDKMRSCGQIIAADRSACMRDPIVISQCKKSCRKC